MQSAPILTVRLGLARVTARHECNQASEKSLVRRLGAPLIFFLLTLASTVATVHAAENPRKMTVVSFGLFGDEGVFRRGPPVQRKSSPIGSGVTQWS